MADEQNVQVGEAKGRPMLHWVGKRPLDYVTAYPAQLVETFNPAGEETDAQGLLFHGDNKDVLAWLLAHGYRGKVDLIYIDPPFDSGADYIRRVQLRGAKSAKLEGEGYTLGEQIQYTDIWVNDTYLQFMYERLLLLKELLAENGSIYLHCDSRRNHFLRCLMEEVFGSENFRSEIVWKRTSAHSDASFYGQVHDTVIFFGKSPSAIWNEPRTSYDQWYIERYYRYRDEDGRRFKSGDLSAYGLSGGGYEYEWNGVDGLWRCPEATMQKLHDEGRLYYTENGIPRLKQYLDEMEGTPVQTLWDDIQPVVSWSDETESYPTQKPEALLDRIIGASSNPGDLVLDCFVGSGTTAAVAQKLGRRWIASDINKGAIQTTSKRLQTIIREQIEAHSGPAQPTLGLDGDEDEAPAPAARSFSVYRVNDYDLQIQHNEAANLAVELIGIERTKMDMFFDGTLGKRLVKIIPFTHPLTLMDLQLVKDELEARPQEERDVVVVCLGKELAVDAWLEEHNKHRPINRIDVIELRTDQKYGKFFMHQPAEAQVSIQRRDGKLIVDIEDFISPTIVERLEMDTPLFRAKIPDWRAMVDVVMIDTTYAGDVFDIDLSDVPERKDDLVRGHYELDAPEGPATVAVKIIEMLGEEVLVTEEV